MANVGRTVPNTIAKAPITFAMVELADPADCNSRKSTWLNYGFKDITPEFGGQSRVPTIDDAMVTQGRQMLQELAAVKADWYMLSGHHGALYAADYYNFPDANHPGGIDIRALGLGEEYCGFFNESYHKGRWEVATRDDPDAANNAKGRDLATLQGNEIYLRTTDAAPSDIAHQKQDNPLFDTSGGAPTPKGVIISACNTLFYAHARQTWNSYFPNAVIIGPVARIVTGTWVTNAIAASQMTNEAFWRDPQTILDQDGNCTKLAQQLKANFPRESSIGVMYKGQLYMGDKVQPIADAVDV